jgi:hypothetical protein
MGKRLKSDEGIKINTKKAAGGKRNTQACMEELTAFFACIGVRFGFCVNAIVLFVQRIESKPAMPTMQKSGLENDAACAKERNALTACATVAVRIHRQRGLLRFRTTCYFTLMKPCLPVFHVCNPCVKTPAKKTHRHAPLLYGSCRPAEPRPLAP